MAGSGSQGRGQRAAALMRRETRVCRGPVPDAIGGERVADGQWMLIGEEFLLRAGGCTIYYRTGHGICVDVASADAERRLDLYLSGTTHAAVACMNGLYPVHASRSRGKRPGNRHHRAVGCGKIEVEHRAGIVSPPMTR